jgi:hypothetical protein
MKKKPDFYMSVKPGQQLDILGYTFEVLKYGTIKIDFDNTVDVINSGLPEAES